MRPWRLAAASAVGLLAISLCWPAQALTWRIAPDARGPSMVQDAYWAYGPYGRYWVPDRPPPPAYYAPPPPPYYAPPVRPRVWVQPFWNGYQWIPGHWRYE